MLLDAFRAIKGGMSKNTKQSLYKNGFFFASGIFAGVALDNMWHTLALGGTDKSVVKTTDTGISLSDTKQDQVWQSMLITAILLASVITGKYANEVIPTAAGAYLGNAWSNQASKSGSGISVLPF